MTSRAHTAEPTRAPSRLYLVTPALAEPAGLADRLAAALGGAPVAAVLLRLADGDDRSLINHVKVLASLVQDTGAALVLDGHPDIAARAGADGAHLTGIDAFNQAKSTLQPERIAGCGGLPSRHDAMLAAEAGADYVLFGEPDRYGRRPSLGAAVDRVAWWAQVFELPCVGFAGTLADVEQVAAAGADFIAVGDCIFDDARGPAAALADAARRIALPEAVR